MAEQMGIMVYGTPEGWKAPTEKEYHKTKWLEWQLPTEVAKEASDFIKKRLKKFFKECQCESCQRNRAAKQENKKPRRSRVKK